jgi:hypothetical protein
LSTRSPTTADTPQTSNAHPCPQGGDGDNNNNINNINNGHDDNNADPPEDRTRLPAPDASAKRAIDYTAVSERIAHDLDHWAAAAPGGSADAADTAADAAANIGRAVAADGAATAAAAAAAAVTDAATGKLCSGAAMLQRVARARARTAVARFEQHVVLMQLAAWVDARVQQPDALRLPRARDRLTAALDELVQHEPQRSRDGVAREMNAGRHWAALVAVFGIGVAALAPSCLGLSNRG